MLSHVSVDQSVDKVLKDMLEESESAAYNCGAWDSEQREHIDKPYKDMFYVVSVEYYGYGEQSAIDIINSNHQAIEYLVKYEGKLWGWNDPEFVIRDDEVYFIIDGNYILVYDNAAGVEFITDEVIEPLQSYPLLDEDDYSERSFEYWKEFCKETAEDILKDNVVIIDGEVQQESDKLYEIMAYSYDYYWGYYDHSPYTNELLSHMEAIEELDIYNTPTGTDVIFITTFSE